MASKKGKRGGVPNQYSEKKEEKIMKSATTSMGEKTKVSGSGNKKRRDQGEKREEVPSQKKNNKGGTSPLEGEGTDWPKLLLRKRAEKG